MINKHIISQDLMITCYAALLYSSFVSNMIFKDVIFILGYTD
jgi:hypothetical protein